MSDRVELILTEIKREVRRNGDMLREILERQRAGEKAS